jgi:hypothetical protein
MQRKGKKRERKKEKVKAKEIGERKKLIGKRKNERLRNEAKERMPQID